ncbi:hypothetical protein [Hyphobacterium marinum]|uniref:Uncharacterized protein n=1 Tax=Hyphobacterium marinum TaxID=3116574 RepID=A0ABU7M1Q1_9PROT|nr:hypothetical protein [Hyphobacterium sp. Y6023]MEE2567180.1 hypothetical protein [Hyphobacterium sp. Y6023]
MRTPLHRRLLYAGIFFATGVLVLTIVAEIADPRERCEERGGTWVVDGRYCQEAGEPSRTRAD